ncbi:MAG: hypothetical protein AAF593_14665 [Planctomycetota bacterium]
MPWELMFWTPENDEQPEDLEGVFNQLKAGETVPGLKPIPVDTILKAIEDTYPELETDDGHRLVFKNGSIRIDWSDQHFLFTSKGNLPQRGRHGLTSILFKTGCWMYEEPIGQCWDTQELAFMVMSIGQPGKLPPNVNDLLGELMVQLDGEILPSPGELWLKPATEEDFEPAGLMEGDREDRAQQCEQCGYQRIGDFLAPDHDVALTAWYGEPNIFVCCYVQRLIGLCWEEIIVFNADQTSECWSNWQADDKVPPWSKRVVQPGPLLDLHQSMLADHSGKPPAQLKAADFETTIKASYRREQEWRSSK